MKRTLRRCASGRLPGDGFDRLIPYQEHLLLMIASWARVRGIFEE